MVRSTTQRTLPSPLPCGVFLLAICGSMPSQAGIQRMVLPGRRHTAPFRLDEGERVHVGIDVHKATYSIAVYSGDRGLLATWAQPADPEVLLGRLRPIRSQVAEVAYEAGPTGCGCAALLEAEGFPVLVVAPSQLLARRARRPETGSTAAAGLDVAEGPAPAGTSRPSSRRPTARSCACGASWWRKARAVHQ